MSVEPDLLHG